MRNRKPAAVLVNYDEDEHLKDTLDVSDPILMKQIARSKSFYAKGRTYRTERAAAYSVLLSRPAKIDGHLTPRDSLGRIAAEKHHDLRDFLRLQKPLDRLRHEQHLLHDFALRDSMRLGLVCDLALHQRRAHVAWAYSNGRNVVCRPLDGENLSEP